MSDIPRTLKYLCFRAEYGFAQYNPDDASIKHTQDVSAAHESSKDDWSDVIGFDLTYYQFVPANISVEQLERENQQLQLRVEQAEQACKLREVNFQKEVLNNAVLSKQIAEKDTGLLEAITLCKFAAGEERKRGDLAMMQGWMNTQERLEHALSTAGSDYIHKDELEKERQLRKRANEDSCADDTAIRDLARNVLDPLLIDGDSNGVPTLVEVVEQMEAKLKHDLANANASVVSQGDSNGRRINHLEQELSQFKEKCRGIVDTLKSFPLRHTRSCTYFCTCGLEERRKRYNQALTLAKELGLTE